MNTHIIQFAPAVTQSPASDIDPIVGGRVELQLLTTLKCNLKCRWAWAKCSAPRPS